MRDKLAKIRLVLTAAVLVTSLLAQSADVVAPDGFTMLNIIPSTADEKLSAADAIEFAERTGNPYCLYSLTLHPQGFPAMKTVDAALVRYRRWTKLLEGSAVRPGILLQAIIGHWTQDLAERETESWQRQVNIKGAVTRYCPLDPGYQDYIREVGRKLAECRPSVILGDDDIRAFSPEAECFCPLHAAEYNRRAGKALTPEEYRQLIAGARIESPEHRLFALLQRDTVVKVCSLIREGIDAVDPSIPAGICEPGWNWAMKQAPDYARAMAGPSQAPFMRLANGCYFERAPKMEIGAVTMRTLSEAERLKDSGVLLLDEADTWPQNLWSKSAAAFHAKLVVAAFAGLKGAKVWHVNAHRGAVPVSRHYTDILAAHRGYYGALSAASHGAMPRGVLVPCHPEFPVQTAIQSGRQADNSYDDGMAQKTFSWFGVPFAPTFSFDEDGIYSLSGAAAIARFTDGQLRSMLSKKALVDGDAAKLLLKRGFGEFLGVSIREDNPLFTGDYDEVSGVHMAYPKRCNPPIFRAAEGARVLSSIIWRESAYVNEFERVSPSTVLYRNRFGGTVVTTAYNPDMNRAYSCTEARQRFIYEILDALEGRPFDNICANAQNVMALVRRANDGSDLVLVQNLNYDGERAVLLRRGEKPSSIEVLGDHGDWMNAGYSWRDGLATIHVDLPFYATRVFRIRK